MALVCGVAWAQDVPVKQTSAPADGYYLMYSESSSGKGWVHYDKSLTDRKFRVATDVDLTNGVNANQANYVWKLVNDNENGTFTLQNMGEGVYIPADASRNQNMGATTTANLKITAMEGEGNEGKWYVTQSNNKYEGQDLYIHTNAPNGYPNLSYYNGHSATGTSIRAQFHKVPETTYTVNYMSGADVVATTTITYPAGLTVPENVINDAAPEGYFKQRSTLEGTIYTVNLSSLPAVSDAPTDGQWAANTTWFQIKNQKNKVVRADALTAEGYLSLQNGTVTSGDAGLWCIVGDAENGYKFYNRAKGANLFLGMKGTGGNGLAVFVDDKAEGYTTAFDIVASTDEGYWCMKNHGSTNSYWNQRDPRLAYWEDNLAQQGDDGSAFLFTQVDLSTIKGLATEDEVAAAQALIKVAPGYPKTTTAQYHMLNVMVNSVGKGVVATELASAVTAYKKCSDIILPENGKAYIIANYSLYEGGTTRYLNYTAGSALSAQSTDPEDASVFVCRELSAGVYAFVTDDGKVLTWPHSDDGYKGDGTSKGYSNNYATGYQGYFDWNKIAVKKNGNADSDFGHLRLVARRYYSADKASAPNSSFIVNGKSGAWDRAGDSYFLQASNVNANCFSSAWILTEVKEYPKTAEQTAALAEIDATIAAIAHVDANASKLGESVGYTHYTVNDIEIFDITTVKDGINNATTVEAINAIKNSYTVTLPKAGTAYKMAFKTKAGVSHHFTVNGTTLSTSTNEEDASVLYCMASTSNTFPYIFISENGKFLKYHESGKSSSANTLTDNYIAEINNFKVEGMVNKSSNYIDSDMELRLGTVAFTVDKRATNGDDTDGCFIIKNSVASPTFDVTSAAYHKDGFTSAIIMTKVEDYTAPDAVNKAVQTANIAIAKTTAKADINANQGKLGEGIGYAHYIVNGNKVYNANEVNAAIDAATTAEEVNAIKESFKYEIPMAGVPYALYDATHNVYLDIHNLGKEKNDASQDRLATLGASAQPLYITGNISNGTWKIHTTPEGGEYLHQAGGERDWNSWVSSEPGDFSWGVEVCTSEGEITYNLKKLAGGYLGTDVSLHKAGEPLYVDGGAAKALNLKLIALPVLAVNNLDAQGVTYPYALTDEQAAKVFGQDNITIAIDVTTATMSGRQALICAADPTQAITGATKSNSPYVAYGFYGSNPVYLPSSADGDRFTYKDFSATAGTNYKVVYVIDQTNKKFSIYIDGALKSTANYPVVSYELQSFDNFSTTDGDKLYIGGGIVNNETAHDKFSGTIHSVKVYNYALTAEEIATIEYPTTDKQESDALKALIAETQELVNSCYGYYVTETALQTTNAEEDYYVSTNAQEDAEGPIANLVDGDYSNHFHSEYTTNKGGNHYINVNLGNSNTTKSFKFKYATRKTATNFPKTIKISGSNDGKTFTTITTVTDLPVGNANKNVFYFSDVIESETAYTQLRFTITENNSGNKEAGGNPYFHMAEFDLMVHSAELEIIYPNSAILPTALETTKAAIAIAQEEAGKNQTASEYAAAIEDLQVAYNELAAAVANGNRPILISLDPEKPYIYKIGSKRGNTKVLQLDYSGDPKRMVAVVDYDGTNMEQAWYFTKGSDDEKVFIHPYMAEGNVLSASSTINAKNAVWAAAKGTATHQEWIVQVVDKANGTYNIKAGDGSNYFSNNGGVSNMMGFWNDKPTTDGGSLFTFELVELKDILKAYKDTHCTKESYAVGEGLGYYQGAAAYNQARTAAVEVLADEEATTEECKNAYIALREAKNALKFLEPEAGKFYRFKGKASGNYMNAVANKAKFDMAPEADCDAIGSVFYLTENKKLMSYKLGTYLYDTYSIGNMGEDNGNAIYFNPSESGNAGYFTLKTDYSGSKYIYDGETIVNRNGSYAANNCEWFIEEVTSLPVTISAAGYTTLYAPVALEIDTDVEAYVVSEVQNSSVLLEQVTGVVPAETGLIIKGNTGNYTFSIGGDATAEITANELKGTVAKSLITPDANTTCYVLANGTSGVGLYKASLNKDANGATVAENGVAFINNAYKVYLPVEKALAQAARALTFRFIGTTEIENVETTDNGQQTTVIYDLTGRRIEKIVEKGMYIINGKKVVIR